MTGEEKMETLPLFARFLARTIGLHYTSERLSELEQKMASLCREQGHGELDKYLIRLMSSPLSQEQIDTLARTLTIGETYFLRDPKSYQVLQEQLLPELIAARRCTNKTLRIWSAGCSSGEEPYSIAILLSRILPDIADWKIRLVATDLNPLALERGRRGIYSKWSFRNAPAWLFEYFSKREDGRYEIIPRIRDMVRFSQVNLADFSGSCETSGMDVIFCRNVMLYFDATQIEKTMARFHASLTAKGWLFVGPTEVDHHIYRGFSCKNFGDAFVLRKVSSEHEATVEPWSQMSQNHEPTGAKLGAGSFAVGLASTLATATSNVRSNATSNGALSAPANAQLSPSSTPGASGVEPLAAMAPAAPVGFASAPETEQQEIHAAGFSEALALYRTGHYQQAADQALRCVAAGEESASALTLCARSYANIGRLVEAREYCEKAIARDRLNEENHYLLSIILEQQGDTDAAIQSLKHALFIDHNYLLAYFALGNLCRRSGDHRESERNFSNALRLLERRPPEEVLPEADGMTAGGLAELIRGMAENRG